MATKFVDMHSLRFCAFVKQQKAVILANLDYTPWRQGAVTTGSLETW